MTPWTEKTQEKENSSIQRISCEDNNSEDNEDCRKDYNSSNSIIAGPYYQITKVHSGCTNKNINYSDYSLCFNKSPVYNKLLTNINNNSSVKSKSSNLNNAPSGTLNRGTQILNNKKYIVTTTPSIESIPTFNTGNIKSSKFPETIGTADTQKAPVTANLIDMNNTYKMFKPILDEWYTPR